MGAFYVNICISDYPDDEIVKRLEAYNDRVFVGPQVNNWTCLVSESLDSQDWRLLDNFGKGLTRGSTRLAFGVLNHDDDMLVLDVWTNGEIVGSYNSCPGYFREDPTEEQLLPKLTSPEAFSDLKIGLSLEAVQATLVPNNEIALASQLHSDFISLVGLPSYSLGASFQGVAKGETAVNWKPTGNRR